MKCKFCEAELEEGATLCPACGKGTAEETVSEETVCGETCACSCEESGEASCECGCQEPGEAACECTAEEPCKCDEKNTGKKTAGKKSAGKKTVRKHVAKPLKGWRLGVVIACGVVLLCVLAGVFVRYGLGIGIMPRENDIFNKKSYTAGETVLDLRGDVVIATFGDRELTNRQLQLYYWMKATEIQDMYAGLVDFSAPLEDQMLEDKTYQQHFLELALDSWRYYEMLVVMAEDAGYEMSQEMQDYLDSIPEQLEGMLTEEYASVDEFLSETVCPGLTQEVYYEFVRTCNLGYEYLGVLQESITATQQDLEDYYTQNEELFVENGYDKDSGMIADVRHILIEPESDTGDDTYTDEEWAACLEKAEALLEEWKNGEATEESFAELAKEHTADGGSKENGGLYEGITPSTNFVPNFLNWTIDEDRQVGDTDIVQSDYGYHIMFYVGGEPLWQEVARNSYAAEQAEKKVTEAMGQVTMDTDFRKIVLVAFDKYNEN